MKTLRAINGKEYSFDWDKLIPKDSGIDQVYIDTCIDQINGGMYETTFLRDGHPIKDCVFLDIGANLGLVSIYASPVCERIVCVEPAPNVFPILEKLTEDFHNIERNRVALSLYDVPIPFYVNDINFTASSSDNTYGKQVEVRGRKLSTMLSLYDLDHVDVCKIDCEGAEGEALDFYQINNAKGIIDCFFIECHNCPKTGWEHKLGTLVGNFARAGYQHMEVNGMALIVRR